MKVNSEAVIWKVGALKLGLTAGVMKETSKMERRTEKVLLNGQQASSTLVAGEMENSMALAFFIIQKKAQRNKENGKMEKESDGSKELKC